MTGYRDTLHYQSAVITHLRQSGWDARRAAHKSAPTTGIAGLPGVSITCSARKHVEIGARLTEAAQATDGDRFPVALIAPTGRPVEQSYAVLALADLAELLRRAYPEHVAEFPLTDDPAEAPRVHVCERPACGAEFELPENNLRTRYCSRSCRDRHAYAQRKSAH